MINIGAPTFLYLLTPFPRLRQPCCPQRPSRCRISDIEPASQFCISCARASTQQTRAPENVARENPSDVFVGAHADQDFMCLRSLSCSDLANHVLVECGYYPATPLLHLCRGYPARYSSHLTFSNASLGCPIDTRYLARVFLVRSCATVRIAEPSPVITSIAVSRS